MAKKSQNFSFFDLKSVGKLREKLKQINTKEQEDLEANTSIFETDKEKIAREAEERRQSLLKEAQKKEQAKKKKQEEEEKKKAEEEEQKATAEAEKEAEDKESTASKFYEKQDEKDRAAGVKSLSEYAKEDMTYDKNKTYEQQFNEWSKDKAAIKFKNYIFAYNDLIDKYDLTNEDKTKLLEGVKSGEYIYDALGVLGKWLGYGASEVGQFFNRTWVSNKVYNFASDRAGTVNEEKKEDYYKFFLDKQNYKAYSDVESNFQIILQKKEEELVNLQDEEYNPILGEIEKKAKDNEELFKQTNEFIGSYVEHSEAVLELQDKLSKAEDDGDTVTAAAIQEEINYHQKEYFRDYYEYGLGVDVAGDTIEDITKNVQKILKDKYKKTYSDKDILLYNVPLTNEKYSFAQEQYNDIQDLAIKYNMRDDKYVTQLQIEKYINTFETYNVFLGQDRKDIIAGGWDGLSDELKNLSQRIKLAQDNGDVELVDELEKQKQNLLRGISWYNRALDDVMSQIAMKGGGDGMTNMEEIMPIFLDILQSDELAAFKDFITSEETRTKFEDKKTGKVDYAKLSDYVKKSDQLQNLGAYVFGEKGLAVATSKQVDIDKSKTKAGKLYREFWKWGYEGLGGQQTQKYQNSKYLDAYIKWRQDVGDDVPDSEFSDEYLDKMFGGKYDFSLSRKGGIETLYETSGDPKKQVEKMFKESKVRGKDVFDRYVKDFANQDVERSQNYWTQMGDVLTSFGTKMRSYPGDTAMTIGAIAIPIAGTADKIATTVGGAKALEQTTALGRMVYSFGPQILGEGIEGQAMNFLFNNTNYGHADPLWDLMDVSVGAFKGLHFLTKYKSLDEFYKLADLEGLLKPFEAKYGKNFDLSMLTSEDLKKLNKMFVYEGLGNIVEKDFSDYLKQDSKGKVTLDKQQIYKDYSGKYMQYLGAEGQERNRTIWQKIVQNGLRKELNTMNDDTINELYKRAVKYIKNTDTTNDILKESGKKGVIRYWLTSEFNSLKKIGQTKLGFLTLSLMEKGGGVNAKINDEFTKIIEGLQKGRQAAKTPEQIAFFDEAIDEARDLWSKRRLLPLQLSEATFGEALSLHNADVKDFNKKFASLLGDSNFIEKNTALLDSNGNFKTLEEGGASGIKQEIIDLWNKGDKEKVAELILGKEAAFEELGGKMYNVSEFVDGIKNLANSTLTEGQEQRLGSLLDVLDKVSKGSIRIIELPNEIKKSLRGMQGFMGYVQVGKKQETIIALASGLVGGVKNLKFNDLNTLIHELGHTLFLSLKKDVQSKLVQTVIDLIDGKEVGPEMFGKLGISGGKGGARYAELKKLYKENKVAFVEELVADMLGSSIAKGIHGDGNSSTTIGEAIINQMAKGEKVRDPIKTDKPFDILGNKFVDMMSSLYEAIEPQRQLEELKGIMGYIAASIAEGGRISLGTSPKSWKNVKKIGYKPTSNFFEYTEEMSKADLNVMKEEGDKIATLTQGISSFDIAGISSVSSVKKMLNDPEIPVEQLGRMISTRRLDLTEISYMLKGESPENQTKFLKAYDIAKQNQDIAVSNLLKFWKNGEIDLTTKIDGYSFADILNNVAVKVTNDGYVDFAGIDFTKFINGQDADTYNKIFYDYMNYITTEYNPDVIKDVSTKLSSAGITGKDFPEMWVNLAKKVQDVLELKAKDGGIPDDVAKMLAEDICSRLFAGSFYYISNIHAIEEGSDLSDLVNQLAYGILYKNKQKAKTNQYTTLYDTMIKEFTNNGEGVNEFASKNLADINWERYGETAKNFQGIDPSAFRKRWYGRTVFNLLAARGEEYFVAALRKMGEEGKRLKMSKVAWSTFISSIEADQSLTKSIVGNIVSNAGFGSDVLDVTYKLYDAHSLDEVCDVYISALKDKKNAKVLGSIGDKDALIKELESLKTRGFEESDYTNYLVDLEKRYLVNAQEDTKLDDYFRSVLTTDEIRERNIEYRNRLRSLTEPVPPTLPKEFKDLVETTDDALNDPQVQDGINRLVDQINKWSNLVAEGENGYMADIARVMLEDELYKPYFNIGNDSDLIKLRGELTASTYSKIQQLIFDVSSEEYKKSTNKIRNRIAQYVNLTTIAAKHRDIGAILLKGVDFVNNKYIYNGDGNIAKFFNVIGFKPKSKESSIKAVVNQIIKTLDDAVKKGIDTEIIKNDIVTFYKRRYHAVEYAGGGTAATFKIKKEDKALLSTLAGDLSKTPSALDGDMLKKYEAAIEAYVDVLAKRHTSMGQFGEQQLRTILGRFLGGTVDATILESKKAKYANQLLGLNGYWLGISTDELLKLDEYSAAWDPDLFKNFLFHTYKHSNIVFEPRDLIRKGINAIENASADLMYGAFYTFPFGVPAAMQQVWTNTAEIFAKTLGEIAFEDIDPKTVDEVMKLVRDLMPSEIVSANKGGIKFSMRAELDVSTRTNIIGSSVKKIINGLSALQYADKSAEGMVKSYALASSLIEQGFNGASTKELISNIVAKMADYGKSGLEDIISFDKLFRMDTAKVERMLNYKIDKLVEEGKLTVGQGLSLKKYGIELSEMTSPLRTAAKQANFKKNAFFQMSQVPELTQNLLAGKAGVANMRFFNWASRKAGEYAYNIADAIMREDRQQLQKYIMTTFYRGLVGAKIYKQVDKATTDMNGVDFYSFAKMIFLPWTVLDMALFNAIDIIHNMYLDHKNGTDKKFIKSVTDGVLSWEGNVKNRLYAAPIYWISKYLEQYNGRQLLNEKASSADYLSGQVVSVPLIQDILNALSKSMTGRLTKYRRRSTGGIFKDNPGKPFEAGFMDALFGTNITNATKNEQNRLDYGNNLMYGDEKFDGEISLSIIPYSRDASLAYQTTIKWFEDKGLDGYFLNGSWLRNLQKDFDKLGDVESAAKALASQGYDGELYKELVEELFDKDDDSNSNKRAKTVLSLAAMKSSRMQGFLEAGKGLTKEEQDNFIKHVKSLTDEILADIEKTKKTNPSKLKNAAYNKDSIEAMIDKYSNRYGEEMIAAAWVSAMVTSYKTEERKALKKRYGDSYQEYLYKSASEGGINELISNGGEDAFGNKIYGSSNLLNDLVIEFYSMFTQGNEMIPNAMMYAHGAMMPDYPLNSKVNIASSFGAQIDDYFMAKNYENRGYGDSGIGTLDSFIVKKIINSNDVSWEDKVDYINRMIDYADLQGPFVSNVIKAGLTPMLLEKWTQIITTDPDFAERNASWLEPEFKKLTVSRPLSDEDIKKEVEKTIYKKQTSSGSGKKGRKGSLSFDDLADRLTKFQALKRQFEEVVLKQTPIQKIAYKATSHGVTPIQLSTGEAHEIDQKYTFIKPKSPESEKTPDIVVKQVKTSTSKYSGKAIKQSNVYKVKKIL